MQSYRSQIGKPVYWHSWSLFLEVVVEKKLSEKSSHHSYVVTVMCKCMCVCSCLWCRWLLCRTRIDWLCGSSRLLDCIECGTVWYGHCAYDSIITATMVFDSSVIMCTLLSNVVKRVFWCTILSACEKLKLSHLSQAVYTVAQKRGYQWCHKTELIYKECITTA